MTEPHRHIHLEHDGKLLLVDLQGNGPAIPQMGRQGEGGFSIRLPTPEEAKGMGLTWNTKRTNRFRLGQEMHEVIVATPEDRKSTRLNSSHSQQSRMPSSA